MIPFSLPRNRNAAPAMLAALAALALCGPPRGAAGQDDPQPAQWAERAARLAAAEARRYEFRLGGPEGPKLELSAKPVLKWSNTYEATVHGSVLIWTLEGRPVVIASLYKFFTQKTDFDAEFHSLATGPLVAIKDEQVVWSPASGITFQLLPDAPPPGRTSSARLTQMREIARQFSATVTIYSGTKHDLRLLPQPLVRYGDGSTHPFDGAIFAYARATDPDVLLVLEARPGAEKTPEWHFALARMHGGKLAVRRGEAEVWTADALSPPYFQKNGAYTTFQALPEPDIDGGAGN